jgi:myo-inositol 2-dehydrogenase / D-chiro-inositol 1-dehydrogenase
VKDLSVAVLGCGRMGRIRLDASRSAGAHVGLAFDVDIDRARDAAAAAPGCTARDNVDDVDWSDFDAIFICTPPADHIPLALATCSSGAALFLEKPLALGSAEAEPLLREQSQRGFPAAVGFMNRLRPSVSRLRELLETAPADLVCAYWCNAAYQVPWWADASRSGGAFREQGAHFVDLLTHLLGRVVEVRGLAGAAPGAGGMARAAACLEFESGALATLAYGAHAAVKTIGMMFFRADSTLRLEGWSLDLVDDVGTVLVAETRDRNAIFFEETELFLASVASGKPDIRLCGLEQAMQTQIVIDRLGDAMEAA